MSRKMKNFFKLLIVAAAGYFLHPIVKPQVDKLLEKFKK